MEMKEFLKRTFNRHIAGFSYFQETPTAAELEESARRLGPMIPQITSLEGAPAKIGGGEAPKITSLEGAPAKIRGGEVPKITSL